MDDYIVCDDSVVSCMVYPMNAIIAKKELSTRDSQSKTLSSRCSFCCNTDFSWKRLPQWDSGQGCTVVNSRGEHLWTELVEQHHGRDGSMHYP